MNYQVNEIFTSIQGEGLRMGVPSTFIRLQGCTVGCSWCDTEYTWKKGGTSMDTGTIISQVKGRNVVITGGEPTLHNLDELIYRLRSSGRYIQLETSGQQWLKGDLLPDWITWSPKENLKWNAPEQYLTLSDEVKWVVDEALSLEKVLERWRQMLTRTPFTFMPEGCPPRPEMVEKTLSWLQYDAGRYTGSWYYSDRLQYRISVQ